MNAALSRSLLIVPALVAAPFASAQEARAGFDHTHAALTRILAATVAAERVDYAALKRDPAPLRAYLDTLAAVPEAEFNTWDKERRLAFLINLYNAATLQLIVDHYPVKSIKDIGGFFSGPWKQEVVRVFGRVITLDEVEHGIIRPQYKTPAAHFALVCASIGCPPLRAEAYDAARLEPQLADQGRRFFADKSKNRVDTAKGELHLSPIFKWFKSDFEGAPGGLLGFVAKYVPEADRAAVLSGKLDIGYTDYDWKLNGR